MTSQLGNDYEEDFNYSEDFGEDQSEVLASHHTVPITPQPPRTFYGTSRTDQSQNVSRTLSLNRSPHSLHASKTSTEGGSTKRVIMGGLAASRKPKLPPLRVAKNMIPLKANDHMTERALSAKDRRVHQLENERNLLRGQTEDLKQEVRTLNQMLRRQGKALGQYESKEERFPTLLHQSDEEIRVMREQLRTARQKYIQLREQYRLLENYAQAAEREREKLSSMVRDKELLDSKALKKERDDLLSQLTALGTKTKDQERCAASQLKAQSKERQFFDGRFKELLKRFENLEAENFVLKHRLGTEYQSEDHRQYRAPRSRSHSQESRRSHSSGRQQKSTLEVNVADPDEKRTITFEKRILRRARRSFLQEFRYATTIPENPLSGRESPSSMDKQSENSASTTVVLDSDAAPQKHLSVSKKPRTSPDLLKDHNQRVTFDSPPSGPRSGNPVEVTEGFDIPQRLPDEIQKVADQMSKRSQSPERTRNKSGNFIETSDTIVRPNQQPVISKDKNLRHDLLEKIRLLDLGKRAGLSGGGDDVESIEAGYDVRFQDHIRFINEPLVQTTSEKQNCKPDKRLIFINEPLSSDRYRSDAAMVPLSKASEEPTRLSSLVGKKQPRGTEYLDEDVEEIEFF